MPESNFWTVRQEIEQDPEWPGNKGTTKEEATGYLLVENGYHSGLGIFTKAKSDDDASKHAEMVNEWYLTHTDLQSSTCFYSYAEKGHGWFSMEKRIDSTRQRAGIFHQMMDGSAL